MGETSEPCPCGRLHQGRPRRYVHCCGPLHAGGNAVDPETLMRARYSAYARGDVAYLRRTWAAETCPTDLAGDPQLRWLGLSVVEARVLEATQGVVRFVARYRIGGGRAARLTETSRFRLEPDGWVYVDGEVEDLG